MTGSERPLAQALDEKTRRLFGRSLKLRQVSAGGCNGCEADVNVLGTLVFDLGRFGIQMVASPRHADGLLITGPVTENMRLALKKTYDAVPAPKIVIAVGACAISGGPYVDHPEVHNGADARRAGRPVRSRVPAASRSRSSTGCSVCLASLTTMDGRRERDRAPGRELTTTSRRRRPATGPRRRASPRIARRRGPHAG